MIKIEYNIKTKKITARNLTPAEMETVQQPQINYEQLVSDLIRTKYTVDQELAINRQRDTKPEEFQEYFDYCEQCKTKAHEQIL